MEVDGRIDELFLLAKYLWDSIGVRKFHNLTTGNKSEPEKQWRPSIHHLQHIQVNEKKSTLGWPIVLQLDWSGRWKLNIKNRGRKNSSHFTYLFNCELFEFVNYGSLRKIRQENRCNSVTTIAQQKELNCQWYFFGQIDNCWIERKTQEWKILVECENWWDDFPVSFLLHSDASPRTEKKMRLKFLFQKTATQFVSVCWGGVLRLNWIF